MNEVRNRKQSLAPMVAEFIGTFFVVFLGCGSSVLLQLSPAQMSATVVAMVFGGTVSVMIYALGHISGAHFNPAVSFAFAAIGRLDKKRLVGYVAAQILGATTASFLHGMIWGWSGHGFGATQLSVSPVVGLCFEFVLSYFLMLVIVSVATDSRAVGELAGLAIGTTVMICALFGGSLTGASMNPARSFAPALFSQNIQNLWVYIVTPILGAVAAAWTYEKLRCENTTPGSTPCC